MSTGAEAVSLSSPRILGGDFSRIVRLWFGLPADADAQSRRLSLEELIAPERWLPPRRSNPELRKALGVIHAQLGETRRLLALPKGGMTLRNAAGLRELRSLVRQEPALLGIDAAWELAGGLKRLNLRLGDEGYVGSRLDHEHSRERETGHWHGWEAHFDPRELARLLKVYRAGSPSKTDHVKAIDRLNFLYLMRDEAGRDRRARAALKCLYLTRLTPMLLVLLAGLAVALNSATDGSFARTIVLTACAGALGSTLSGVFKVRDQLVRLDELRGFWPAMQIQPFVGACAGLIVFLLLESKTITFGSDDPTSWSIRGLLAFAAGFSEPFFLGIVQRVTVVSDTQPQADETRAVTATAR